MEYHQPNLENEHRDYKSLLLNLRHQDTLDLRQGLISPLVRYTRKKPARPRASEQRSRLEDGSGVDAEDENENGYEDEGDSANWVMEGGVRKRIKGEEDKEEGDEGLSDVFGSIPPPAQPRPVLQRIPPEDERTLFPLYVSQLPPPPLETLADEILLLAKRFSKQDWTRCSKARSTRLPARMDFSQTVESSIPIDSPRQPPSAQPQPRSPPPSISRPKSHPPSPHHHRHRHHHRSSVLTQSNAETPSLTPEELVRSTKSLLAHTLNGLSKVTPVDTFGTARAKKKKLREAESGWERVLNVLEGLDQESLDPIVRERTIARLESIYGPRTRIHRDYHVDEVDELANDSDLNPGQSRPKDKTRHKRNAPILTKKEEVKQEEARLKSQETLERQFAPSSLFRPSFPSGSSCSPSYRGSGGSGSVDPSEVVGSGLERRPRKRTRGMSESSESHSDDFKDENSDLSSEEEKEEGEEEEEQEEGEETEEEQEEGVEEEGNEDNEIIEGTGLTIFHSPFIPSRKRPIGRSTGVKKS